MASSPALRHQAFRSALKHQMSRSALGHQAWLTTHVRNPEDLTGLICPSKRSNWHCGRRKTSHFWCQMELILVQTEWSQTGYMSALVGQRVLSLGRTRGGKPPTLTTVAFLEESYKLCMLSWYALYHLLLGISWTWMLLRALSMFYSILRCLDVYSICSD